jgi:hypothetical protein
LNFVSRSTASFRTTILLFQQNVALANGSPVIAWKVIRNCGYCCNHPFDYDKQLSISIGDCYGNYSPRKLVNGGDVFAVVPAPSGRRLVAIENRAAQRDVHVRNDLPRGAIDVNVFRGVDLLWRRTSLVPQQETVFRFEPTLWIGEAPDAVRGEQVSPAVVGTVLTQLPLFGVTSADIVMTGGEPGPDSTPIAFKLSNLDRA